MLIQDTGALVSDDIDMLHIHEKGHLDYKIRRCIEAGVDPVKAIQMATINPAESLKIDDKYGLSHPENVPGHRIPFRP